MLTLRDFFHLPLLEPFIDEISAQKAGLIVVAGLEARQFAGSGPMLPSGRSVLFEILLQNILLVSPTAQAIIVSKEKNFARPPRQLKRRVERFLVEGAHTYSEKISAAILQRPNLLVIDRLTPETTPLALEAAGRGLLVLAPLNSLLRGPEVARQLLDLGASLPQLAALAWVLAVQRLPALCPRCREQVRPDPEGLERLATRCPFLADLIAGLQPGPGGQPEAVLYAARGCAHCRETGRYGDVATFDVFQAGRDPLPLFEQKSRLPLETYMLHLARLGYLSLDDLQRLEADQLRRLSNLLLASEQAMLEVSAELQGRLVELEAANRVLVKRTEVLVSLEDIGQMLIGSHDLEDLAARVCRRASELCSADRAILYLLSPSGEGSERAEVLAVRGWDTSLIHRQVDLIKIFGSPLNTEPELYPHLPPGVTPRPLRAGADDNDAIQAGLSLPLIAQDRQVGLMIVHSTQKKLFTPGEVALLRTFANQAALAIQRAGLIADLRHKIVQLEQAQAELVQKERMERELELARQLQQSLLPQIFPLVPGFSFAARNEPARQVGGDFYDVIDLGEGYFAILIADVSDKGMPAALYMALTRSLILAEARRDRSPRGVLANVNRLLLELGKPDAFVSVFYGVVDTSTRQMTYTRAGHERPLLLRRGRVHALGGEGTVLGILGTDELRLSEEQLDLSGGDRLVLYTDGLTDVTNPEGRFFGAERLKLLLRKGATLSPNELCTNTFNTLADYQGSSAQFDDITLLVAAVA